MRTLGPGSIAALLKMALDVVYAVLWAALAALGAAAAAVLLAAPFLLGRLKGVILVKGEPVSLEAVSAQWPTALLILALAALYVLTLTAIVRRLRQVFAALTRGDPFQPENVRRLRGAGLGLIVLEVLSHVLRFVVGSATGRGAGDGVNLSAWFAILVVFVLAEVFREGARLRLEADLTV